MEPTIVDVFMVPCVASVRLQVEVVSFITLNLRLSGPYKSYSFLISKINREWHHKKVSNSKNFLTTHLSRNKIINNLCQKKVLNLEMYAQDNNLIDLDKTLTLKQLDSLLLHTFEPRDEHFG